MLADGEDVEQALRRMLVGAVAGVDDAAVRCWASRCGAPGDEWRTTTTSMPIASMFLAVSMNVSPLLRLEPPGGEIDGVGAEPLGGQAEAGARPRGRLEEQVDDDLALKIVAFRIAGFANAKKRLRQIEDAIESEAVEPFEAEQIRKW